MTKIPKDYICINSFHLKKLAVGIKHLRHKNATPISLGGPRVEKEICPSQQTLASIKTIIFILVIGTLT